MSVSRLMALLIVTSLSAPVAAGQNRMSLAARRDRSDDEKLNGAYQRIIERLSAPRRGQLRLLERHWLARRKKECTAEADSYSTGSWWPVIYGECFDSRTIVRIEWLKKHYRHDQNQTPG